MQKTVVTRKHCNLPQPQRCREGVAEIVACSQPYLAVLSCIYSCWHSVIPTSYFIFTLVSLIFSSNRHGKRHPSLNCMCMRMWYVQRKLCCYKVKRVYVYKILPCEGTRHVRSKMRPLYVKIMVCRPFSLAVGRF